ncbi:MAG TPA: ribosomal protein S18-alanine N-acetyltransferase [Polyangiales bacterium]|nr:ribosomal protein S18-alanine N-acetyltransferase [Polyangiales bacterium]
MKNAPKPVILPMLASDLTAVERIAERCFPVPWTRQEFEKELRRDYAVLRVLRPSLGEPVCAFANYWHIGDELQLMNVATLPELQRRGHGSALIGDLLQNARERHVKLISLEVRRSNDPARSLYVSFGFREVGVRQRYYSDNGEDAIVMQLALRPGEL